MGFLNGLPTVDWSSIRDKNRVLREERGDSSSAGLDRCCAGSSRSGPVSGGHLRRQQQRPRDLDPDLDLEPDDIPF
jgi:hypothetical protein